jgi:hypothetical protein
MRAACIAALQAQLLKALLQRGQIARRHYAGNAVVGNKNRALRIGMVIMDDPLRHGRHSAAICLAAPREVHGKVMPRNHIPRDEADQLSLERRDVQIRSSVANMLGSFADDAVDLMDEEFLHRGSGEGRVALCHGAFLPSSSWPSVALGALFG